VFCAKVFCCACLVSIGGSLGLSADETDYLLWPAKPVQINPAEALIECFWIRRHGAAKRWVYEGGEIRSTWDATHFDFHGEATLSRRYDLDASEYQRLLVRLQPGASVRTSVFATINGKRVPVANSAPGSNETIELGGPIPPGRLERLELSFSAKKPGRQTVQLRWILLTRPGKRWQAPERPFEGMIAAGGQPFQPGLGLLFGEDELAAIRKLHHSSLFAQVWRTDQQLAEASFAVDPASMIRKYSLYAPARYGRVSDPDIFPGQGSLRLALVGLITQNDEYMRQAARHAVAFARMEHWAEGFVDRTPTLRWHHAGFAANVATIEASLLLDWTWNWLTPSGRQLVREAICDKGLPQIESHKQAMANQGVRFNKGRIFGWLAISDDWSAPDVHAQVSDSIAIINSKLADVVHPDGTFSEGMGYGKGTIASTFLSYVAASRCLGIPVKELASPSLLTGLRYIREADGEIGPILAAFAAGPLSDRSFTPQCTPMHLLQNYDRHGPGRVSGNSSEFAYFGLGNVWAPRLQVSARRPEVRPFALYADGGWVFMGSDDPDLPRVRFESGLWDGHGHAWMHKHAVTMAGWGRTLLLPRFHVAYSDARSNETQSTRLNNTFSPGGRNQDSRGEPGRGAKLLVAQNLGSVALAASDNASAWEEGVAKAVRRVIFIRPDVLLVEDVVELTRNEPGVQSWNSLNAWRIVDGLTCEGPQVRLTCLAPRRVELTAREESVHRDRKTGSVVPAYRAAFTTPAGTNHHLLTLIQALPPAGAFQSSNVEQLSADGTLVEITRGERVTRITLEGSELSPEDLWGHTTDGGLFFATRERGKVVAAAAFDATWIAGPNGRTSGKGFIALEQRP
jgi:hypothetical protein